MIETLGADLPVTWSVSRLKRVTEILSRGTAPTYVDVGPVKAINQASNQSGGLDWSRVKYHDHTGDPSKLKGYIIPGDLFMNSTGNGTLGRVGYFAGDPEGYPCMVDSHVTQIRVAESVFPRYAYYWLNSTPFQQFIYAALTVGATNQIELNRDRLADAPIPVPPLVDQRRIANFLDIQTARIDEIARRADCQLELLKLRRRAFIEDRLRNIGEGVEKIPLKRLLRPSYDDCRPDLQVLSVYRDYGVIPKSSREDNYNKTPEDVSRYLVVQSGDLVVNKMKAWQGSLAVSNYEGIVSPDYLVARITHESLNSKYLHYLLRSPRLVAEYAMRSRGVRPAQWRIYWEDLRQIAVPIPTFRKQRDLADELVQDDEWVENSLRLMVRRSITLAERRQALIAAAVTGQFDVSTASGRGVEV